MMRHLLNRFLSIELAFFVVFSSIQVPVYAEEIVVQENDSNPEALEVGVEDTEIENLGKEENESISEEEKVNDSEGPEENDNSDNSVEDEINEDNDDDNEEASKEINASEDLLENEIEVITEETEITLLSASGNVVASGKTGTANWEITGNPGNYKLTISGAKSASYSASSSYNAPWKDYATEITSVDVVLTESLGAGSFYGFTNLTDVNIGYVPKLSGSTFYNCTSLQSVDLSNVDELGITEFYGCKNLESVVLPSELVGIPHHLFYNCKKLKYITLPSNITTIAMYAFYGCSSLESIIIPNSVTEIGDYAFADCNSLVAVSGATGLKKIYSYAFRNCSKLTSFSIPKLCESIQNGAFTGCVKLDNLYFFDNNVEIYDSSSTLPTNAKIFAYSGSSAISYAVKYNRQYEYLDSDVSFVGKLTDSITYKIQDGKLIISGYGDMPDFVSVSTQAANLTKTSAPWNDKTQTGLFTEVEISEGITSIGAYSFYGENIRNITLPSTLVEIREYALSRMNNLTGIVLPEGLLIIGENAFANTKISTIELPNSLNEIDKYAFGYTQLTEIVIPANVRLMKEGILSGSTVQKIVFKGPAPQIYTSLSGVTATVYYPYGDPTWTDEVKKSCAGTLTWMVSPSTVTFDANGGELVGNSSKEVTYGEQYGALPTATKPGYVFKGWAKDQAGNSIVLSTTIVSETKDHKLYAKWEEATIKISFDAQGGVAEKISIDVVYGKKFGQLPSASRTGFYFIGWFTEKSGGEQITEDQTMTYTQNTTLFAQWKSMDEAIYSGDCDNGISWEISGYGELRITGVGDMSDYLSSAPWTKYASMITEISVSEGITYISGRAFADLSEVKSVTLPTTLVRIGDYCFVNTGLKTVVIPNSVKTIGKRAFEQCYELSSFRIGAGVNELGDGFILLTPQLSEISVDSDNSTFSSIDGVLFNKDGKQLILYPAGKSTRTYRISENVERISEYAFKDNHVLEQIEIPNTVSMLESGVFYGCDNLTRIILSPNLTELPDFSFYGCKKMVEIEIPPSIAKIGANSFGKCDSLSEIVVPYGVETIDEHAFAYSQNLSRVYIPETVTSITGDITEGSNNVTVYCYSDYVENIALSYGIAVVRLNTYQVEKPKFNISNEEQVERGTLLFLSCDTNGAEIYYTTDGTTPSRDNGKLYEDAIVVEQNINVQAIALKNKYRDSDLSSISIIVKDESQNWGGILEQDQYEFINADAVPSDMWTRGICDMDYSGTAITFPNLRVYKGKELLKQGTDYTVKYSNNIKAGNATITVTGKGNYSGTIIKTFKINPIDIGLASAQDITLAFNNKVQKGTTPVTYMLNGVNTTLKANSDFTFVYPKTNSKAADYDAAAFKVAGVYEVQIVGKGNYTGTKTFNLTITQLPLISKMTVKGITSKVAYTGSAITQDNLEVWNGKVKLTEGADYTVEHKNNTDIGTASVVITGKGAFAGAKTVNFTITGYAFKNAIFGKEVTNSYTYTGSDIRPVDENASLSYKKSKTETVHLKGIEKASYESLNSDSKRDYDYIYEYVGDTVNIGTVKVVYTGINAYTGTVSKNYKIIGTSISKMTVDYITVNNYTGNQIKPDVRVYQKATKTTPEKVFVLGTDYIVSYENNVNASKKATIIITGINECTGTIKKTFTISPKDIESLAVNVENAVYQKGGSRPAVIVRDGAKELVSGADYTVTFSNNTKVNDGITAKAPTAKIVGKGNYKGTVSKTFAIASSNMDNVTISASDITYQNKAGICKPTIKLFDSNGKALASGTDYEKTVTYRYAKDVMVSQVVDARRKTYKDVVRAEGTPVDPKDIIPVGAEITAYLTGRGNYPGSKEVTFRFVSADISKATITVATQYYTGKEIRPTKDDITVKVGKETLKKTDYEISGYNKNVAKGSAEITIRGIGNYGGSRVAKFTIAAKPINYTVIFDKNASDAAGKMKNQVISVDEAILNKNTFSRKGSSFYSWNTMPDGSGTTIMDAETISTYDIKGKCLKLYAQWTIAQYHISYNLDGGINDANNPEVYNYFNETIILKDPVKENYYFMGWYNGKTKVTSIPKGSTGDRLFSAKWRPINYNVVFDANGGTGITKGLSNCKYDSSYVLPDNKFTKNGYSYSGWNTKKDGTGTNYQNKQTVKNLALHDGENVVLYAKWDIINYSISYNLNGYSCVNKNPVTYNVNTNTIVLESLTNEYARFVGWYSDTALTKQVTSIKKGSTGNIVLYAKWEYKTYTVVFEPNSDANPGNVKGVMEPLKCRIGVNYNLPMVTYTYYANMYNYYDKYRMFVGWNTKPDGSGQSFKNKEAFKNLCNTDGASITLYAQWSKISNMTSYDEVLIQDNVDVYINAIKSSDYRDGVYSYSVRKNGQLISSGQLDSSVTSDGDILVRRPSYQDLPKTIRPEELKFNGKGEYVVTYSTFRAYSYVYKYAETVNPYWYTIKPEAFEQHTQRIIIY